MPEDEEAVHYEEPAEIGEPVPASEMPAKPVQRVADPEEAAKREGPGERVTRAKPVKPAGADTLMPEDSRSGKESQ